MPDPFDSLRRLKADVHATGLHFLQVELEVGNTMLDTAGGSQDPETRTRRLDRAREAHDSVARQLARGPELELTPSEREEVTGALARLKTRIDAAV